jgi:hypothetical protein
MEYSLSSSKRIGTELTQLDINAGINRHPGQGDASRHRQRITQKKGFYVARYLRRSILIQCTSTILAKLAKLRILTRQVRKQLYRN